jgi:hypothetical protein
MATSRHVAEETLRRIESRRWALQDALDKRSAKALKAIRNRMAAVPVMAPAWLLPLPTWAMIGYGVAHAGAIGYAVYQACELPDVLKARRDRVYVLSEKGNDPTDAMEALDDLVACLRAPGTQRARLLASYENAVDRVQGLLPDRPLSQLEAYGYYPSRPRRYLNNDRYEDVDHDKIADSDPSHWERAMKAMETLRALLRSTGMITFREVTDAVSALVPPLRASLRARGIETWRIERLQPPLTQSSIGQAQTPSLDGPVRDATPALRAPEASNDAAPLHVGTPDALTPIEDRLNVGAAMTAMSLRSIITAFRSANPSLFMGDDRQTAETMLDDHLPRTIAAFVIADDAGVGAEKDEVRAEFARSLSFLRDNMSGIMERHRHAARQTFETQTRFVESRHGPNELSG